MTEPRSETAVGPVGWVQDQVYDLKGRVAQVEQQLEHVRSASTELHESVRTVQAALRAIEQVGAQLPRLQGELNQAAALIVQLQDDQVASREKLEVLGRRRDEVDTRDQQDVTDLTRRAEQLERRVEQWQDRQAGVEEVGRRFQEGVTALRVQLQRVEQRLEPVEGRAARALEGANRAEHTLTEVDATLLALKREDQSISERARVAADVAHRLEGTLSQGLQELRRLELLADRIELHRAERQRLEERVLHIAEETGGLQERLGVQEQEHGRLRLQQQTAGARLDAVEQRLEEQWAAVVQQLRRLISSQERTKRRQVSELERELREMRKHAAGLGE